MKATPLAIPDVILFEPKVFGDDRGFFFESFNHRRFEEAVGKPVNFVQDNHSRSVKNVLRGLHYQIRQPQGKLVRVVEGEVFDVAVDLRKNSATIRPMGRGSFEWGKQTSTLGPGGFCAWFCGAERNG
jgi:dTDP-4-dehydrorhamnose 3,5-epimerase